MEPLKQLNLAMRYIENHLAEEIDFQRAAQIACCSEYHFRRLFSSLCGMSISEYIRRRRLALAALELGQSDIKIIDLAMKYGYDSPDSFARAFQTMHGVTPREARSSGVPLKAVPPMTFQLTIQGGDEMDYRIVEKSEFWIIGLKKRVPLIYHGVNPEIAAMAQTLTEADIQELRQMSDVEPMGFLSASFNFTEGRSENTELDHMIGVAASASHSGKWHTLSVPASTWAVFTAIGPFPDTLQNVWGRIYSEWFAMSGYELSEGPEMLWNESKDTSLPKYRSEIWIPVTKK
ncbi:AraC family transcriptional regulator [Paenibacillus harenae]|uniref:AraC family transcriptional regulator n=1 Tax=Paenibacillus harenae TaxID=306543 RepID=UPI002792E34C|nr:AraC family transcriptional regulator [Paenibacillus harenae]MDQ0062611.1 AraC family transcriptional regulator [Paenibacillus harenae]